jgi:hypothetical protein
MVLTRRTNKSWRKRSGDFDLETDRSEVLGMQFPGARAGVRAIGEAPLPGKVNYFVGNGGGAARAIRGWPAARAAARPKRAVELERSARARIGRKAQRG